MTRLPRTRDPNVAQARSYLGPVDAGAQLVEHGA